MLNVQEVQELENPDKSYDIYYNGKILLNVSVEQPMTPELAFAIINEEFAKIGLPPRKHISRVTFNETNGNSNP